MRCLSFGTYSSLNSKSLFLILIINLIESVPILSFNLGSIPVKQFHFFKIHSALNSIKRFDALADSYKGGKVDIK